MTILRHRIGGALAVSLFEALNIRMRLLSSKTLVLAVVVVVGMLLPAPSAVCQEVGRNVEMTRPIDVQRLPIPTPLPMPTYKDLRQDLHSPNSTVIVTPSIRADALSSHRSGSLLSSNVAASPGSGRGGGLTPSWRGVAVPAGCLVEDELTSTDACNVIDYWELVNALNSSNRIHELSKLMLKRAAEKLIVVSFPSDRNMDAKVRLIEAMYNVEVLAFDNISRQIVAAMTENPRLAAYLKEEAKLDSYRVEALRQQIFSEKESEVSASVQYLESHPHSSGITFSCSTACHQLSAAARGANVWDGR